MWSNRPAKPSPLGSQGSADSGLNRVATLSVSSSNDVSAKRLPFTAQHSSKSGFGLDGGLSSKELRLSEAHLDEVSMPASVSEAPKKYIKQYELGRTLGKGSYAKVKMCTDLTNGKVYAIKVFNKSLLKRRRLWDSEGNRFKTAFDDVLREIAIMRKLDHENVMTLKDVIDDMAINKLYMVIDYCKHGAVMDSHELPTTPLPLNKVRRWFADAVVGLDYLHFQDIVHFDLKPDNILIADDGRAVIADFGVSRMMSEGNRGADDGGIGDDKLTSGSPGTPSYTAPEVWGSGKYEAKKADVWALGVTLHAMAFGTLPFFSMDQQKLIEQVTAPEEWTCEHEHEDAEMLELLHGMIRKNPSERMELGQVKLHSWVADERKSRAVPANQDYKQIVINEADLRQAVISGHIENFRRDGRSIFKTTNRTEAKMYKQFGQSAVSRFLPPVRDVKESTAKRVIIEMDDLTHELQGACLMDVKMGQRTFTEEDASGEQLRDDLLAKMLKVDPDAATAEEVSAGGITKIRYLQFREGSTTTRSLGFRVDAIRLADGVDSSVPDADELRTIITEKQVTDTIYHFVQQRKTLLESFAKQLHELRECVEGSELFMSHSFLRTSLLFSYSDVTNTAKIHIIDLSRVSEAGRRLTHRSPWESGNHEDGYLTGLDNLSRIFESLLA